MYVKLFVLSLFCCFVSVKGQVVVAKRATSGNLTIIYRGVSGNNKLSSMLGSDLHKCGWFNITTGGKVDYNISGKYVGQNLTVSVSNGKYNNINLTMQIPATGNQSWIIHKMVDAILKKLFAIDGICSSSIAFTGEITNGIKEIYICDFDGSNVTRITHANTLSVEPDWSPSSQNLVYTMYGKSSTHIVERDLKKGRSRRLAVFDGLNAGAAISPSGQKMTLILSKDGKVDMYIKSLVNWKLRRLTNNTYAEASPCWSIDEKQICYTSGRGGRPKLYIMNNDGTNIKRIPTIGVEAVSPDWSTDNKIVYASKLGRNYSIAYIDLNGTRKGGNITNGAGDWENPSWAPDNRHIVCSRTLNGTESLYIVDTWTGKFHKLLQSKMRLSLPSWSNIR